MADGSKRPIKDVNVGDKVLATDPKSGLTTARPVTRLHINTDTELTNVTVKVTEARAGPRAGLRGKVAALAATAVVAAGVAVGSSTVVQTTAHHPFWDDTTSTWVNAADLQAGHELRTADGKTATVTAVNNFTGTATMRDLTVDTTHTYYVLAGTTPVLVHNCGGRHASGETAPDSDYVGRHRAPGTDIEPFYPRNDGFQGETERTWLYAGDQFDRYGHEYGRFTSPVGTPMPMRALPPGAADREYHVYEVVKPFEVQAGKIAPAFGEIGGGTQYVLPLSVRALLTRGVIRGTG